MFTVYSTSSLPNNGFGQAGTQNYLRTPELHRKSSLTALKQPLKDVKHGIEEVKKRGDHFSLLTLHGAGDIINSPSTGFRLFWVAVVAVALGLGSWICALIVNNITKDPTVTKISYETPSVSARSAQNYFLMSEKLIADNVSDNAVRLALLSGPIWFLADVDVPDEEVLHDPTAISFKKSLKQKHGTSEAAQLRGFFLEYGVGCSDLFFSCRNANWQKLNCCQIFRPVFNFQHGLCFAADPERMPIVGAAGLFSNFYIKVKRPQLWTNSYRISEGKNNNASAIDLIVDAGIDQGIWRADNLLVNYGNWALLQLTVKFSPNFTTPRNCILPTVQLTRAGYLDDNDWFKFSNRIVDKNRSGNDQCLIIDARRFCTASEIRRFLYGHWNATRHKKGSNFQGITYWLERFNISGSNPCTQPCDRWDYSYSVSEDYEEDILGHDYAGFTLTFAEPEIPRIEEVSALNWYDYVALIGGVFGLWMGASVITAVQIVVYFVRLCMRPKQKEVNSETEQKPDSTCKTGGAFKSMTNSDPLITSIFIDYDNQFSANQLTKVNGSIA